MADSLSPDDFMGPQGRASTGAAEAVTLFRRTARFKVILLMALAAMSFGQAAYAACDPKLTGEFADAVGVAAKTGDYRAPKLQFGGDYEDLIGLPCDEPAILQTALMANGWEAASLSTRIFDGDTRPTTMLLMRSRRTGFLGLLVGGYIGHLSVSFVDGQLSRVRARPTGPF